MLALTLKLKTVESTISVEGVPKGKRNTTLINKIEKIELKEDAQIEKRKEIKVPEKRDVAQEPTLTADIKKINKADSEKSPEPQRTHPEPQHTQTTYTQSNALNKEEKPKMYPNKKKY